MEDGDNLFVRDAEVTHGDGGVWVVEAFAEDFESNSIFGALDISESFAEGVCAVVSLEVYCSAPFFDFGVDGHDGERSSGGFSWFEKVIIIFEVWGVQIGSESLVDGFVDDEDVWFSSFWFFDLDLVSGFCIFELCGFEFEEVASSDAVIDAEGEEEEVTGVVCEQFFDWVDVVEVCDGLNGDGGTVFGVVWVWHERLLEN